MASNARNLSKLLGTSTQVPTTALPPAIADLETVGQSLSGGEISPSSIKSNTLTQSFDSNQAVTFNMADSIDTVSPIVSVFKEVPQQGFSSKGKWDVNANATNYEFFDEKPISYSSATLTPSATGDGTFTNSTEIVTGYNFTNFAYDSVTAATGISGNNEAIRFNNNGTKMYILSDGGPDGIYQFSLSTAYDITTASYDSVSFSVTQDSSPRDFHFNSDGSKMFILGSTNRSIYKYSLSTPYDLSTTSYDSVSLSIAYSTSMLHFHFNGDGTKIYVGSSATWTIYERQLPGAYDISSESAVSTFGYNADLPSGSTEAYAYSGIFNDDGTKMYLLIGRMPDTSEAVIEYDLSTAYDLSTISRTSIQTLNPSNAGNDPRGMTWNSDGTKLIILTEPDDMFRFTSSTSSAFNAADVGKKVVGNSGSAIITSTAGAYTSVTPFADTSAISSWQLFGAEGKADGSGIQLTSIGGGYDFSNLSYTGRSFYLTGAVATLVQAEGMSMKPDGTKMWVAGKYLDQLVEFSLSTPYEIDTASSTGTTLDISSYESTVTGIHVNSEGTRLIIIGSNQDEWNEFHLSTGWDLTTATHDQVRSIADLTTGVGAPQDLVFNDDGTRLFICDDTTDKIFGYTLSTAFDISTLTSAGELSIASIETGPGALSINNDGTELYISGSQNDNLQMLKLDTAYDLSSYNASASLTYSWVSDGSGIGTTPIEGITISKSGSKLYLTSNSEYIYEYDFGAVGASNVNSYSPALTNSSTGQINSSSWLDINSMTADETKNDGDIFYAVSTDNRTSWGVAKASDGVRKIVKNNSGTWQYNNDGGTFTPVSSLADAEYSSQFSIAAGNKLRDIIFNSDGTKMYLLWFSPDVKQYSLSTAYDISTAVYDSINLTTNSEETLQTGMKWNNDGTKLYIIGYSNDKVHEYILTTAYDLSTASYNNVFFSVSTQMATPFGLTFKSDGTKFYVTDNGGNIYQYSLSIAWDMSSAAYDNISFSIGVLSEGPIFNSLGTKLYYVNSNILYRWNLSTAWDISTLTSESSLDFDSDLPSNGLSTGLAFNGDESNIYVTWRNADGVATINLSVLGYSTSETWVNGTNNNEHATLQEALTSQSFNRMNKAQLDAVADGYHFSQDSADTLDLMIAPYAASGTSPISDGVTINYDAASKYKQAIHGTEYDVEFTTTNSVDLTSKVSANLKARVL